MASSSSSSQRKPGQEMLPLIPCPSCKDKVLSFLCGPTGSRPGDRFYKCIHKDSGKCRFYEWQEGYAKFLQPDPVPVVDDNQIQGAAPPGSVPGLDKHLSAVLAIVKELLRLNLVVVAANLMATGLLLVVFIAICAMVIMSRTGNA